MRRRDGWGRVLCLTLGAVLLPWACTAVLAGCGEGEVPTPAAALAPGSGFRVIGHRGAAGLAPENTLEALARAAETGVAEVEIDVRLSRDGVVVLFHDPFLGGKTQLRGTVADHDLAELRQAEIGTWFDRHHPNFPRRYAGTRLATLDEALARFGPRFLWHIELKTDEEALPGAVLDAVRRAGVEDRVIVISFRLVQLQRMHELAPGMQLCQLLGPRAGEREDQPDLTPRELIDRAAEEGFAMVGIPGRRLRPSLVAHAHERGLVIRAYDTNSGSQLPRLVEMGVDGATVDRPDRALAWLAQRAAGS